MVKGWMEQESAARSQLQREQRQFLQELHGLAAAIECRVAHVELQATTRCVELVGSGAQQQQNEAVPTPMLARKEVEAMAERAAGRAADRAAESATRRTEEALRELHADVDKWRQEHVVVMAEFVALQGKVAACSERSERACRVATVWDSAVGALRALINGLGPALDSTEEQLKRIEEMSIEVQAVQQAVAGMASTSELREEVGRQEKHLAERCSQLEGTLEILSRSLAATFASNSGTAGTTFVASTMPQSVAPVPVVAASPCCVASPSPRRASVESRRPASASRGYARQPEAFSTAVPFAAMPGAVPMLMPGAAAALQQAAGQALYSCCRQGGGPPWEAVPGGATLPAGLAAWLAEGSMAGEIRKPLSPSPSRSRPGSVRARASSIHQGPSNG